MDNNNTAPMEQNSIRVNVDPPLPSEKKGGNTTTVVVVLVVLILAVVGGALWYFRSQQTATPTITQTQVLDDLSGELNAADDTSLDSDFNQLDRDLQAL